MRFVAKYFLILLPVLASGWADATFAAAGSQASIKDASAQSTDIEVFVREGCPHCAKAKEFLAKLQHEQPGLRVVIRDVSREPAAMERLQRIAENHGAATVRVPAFEVGGQLIVGFSDEANTDQLIRDSLARAPPRRSSKQPKLRAVARQKTV